MIAACVVFLLCTGLVLVALLMNRARTGRPEVLRTEVSFGTGLTVQKVEAVLSGMAGLPPSVEVGLELNADQDGIAFSVIGSRTSLRRIEGLFRGVVPDAKFSAPTMAGAKSTLLTTRIGWRGNHVLLSEANTSESVAALLGSISSLRDEESVTLRWRLRPARGPHELPDKRNPEQAPWSLPSRRRAVPTEARRQLQAKYAGPVLIVSGDIEVVAPHALRSLEISGDIEATIRSRQGGSGSLDLRTVRFDSMLRRLSRPKPARLSPREVASLIGWPIDEPQIQGLSLGTSPALAPDRRLLEPVDGRTFGRSTWPGTDGASVRQPVEGALSHSLILGGTGSGKSVLVTSLAAQDVAQGRGVLLVDMKGDTAADLLARIDPSRADQVIVLDPAEGGPVPGLRVFQDGDPELAADLLLSTFHGLFKDSFGVRSQQYLRQGFVTLANDPEATLADLIFLFNDAAYRARLVGKLDDPMLQAEWAAYESMRPAEQAQHLASPLRKIHEVVGRRIVRAVLAQAKPRFSMKDVLAKGLVVVVSLSPGRLGEPASRLLGSLVVYELFKATLARQSVPETARLPFALYIDEPKLLGAGTPVPIDQMFELFRGMGVGVTMAAQSITQLPRETQRAALTNAATIVAFRQGRSDAELLSRELPGVSAESLQHLDRFEAAVRVGIRSGEVASPATISTLPPSEPVSDPAWIRKQSAERFGQSPEQVDADLKRRHSKDEPEDRDGSNGQLGQRRRRS